MSNQNKMMQEVESEVLKPVKKFFQTKFSKVNYKKSINDFRRNSIRQKGY